MSLFGGLLLGCARLFVVRIRVGRGECFGEGWFRLGVMGWGRRLRVALSCMICILLFTHLGFLGVGLLLLVNYIS